MCKTVNKLFLYTKVLNNPLENTPCHVCDYETLQFRAFEGTLLNWYNFLNLSLLETPKRCNPFTFTQFIWSFQREEKKVEQLNDHIWKWKLLLKSDLYAFYIVSIYVVYSSAALINTATHKKVASNCLYSTWIVQKRTYANHHNTSHNFHAWICFCFQLIRCSSSITRSQSFKAKEKVDLSTFGPFFPLNYTCCAFSEIRTYHNIKSKK